MLAGDVVEAAFSRTYEAPDRIVPAQRLQRHYLAESDLLGFLRHFQVSPFVDSERRPDLRRNRHLALGGHFYHLHENILTHGKPTVKARCLATNRVALSRVRTRREYQGASLPDIAPTILHELSEPVPLGMDGKVLAPIFESEWLSANPPRHVEKDITGDVGGGVSREGTEEALERLRALGYIQ